MKKRHIQIIISIFFTTIILGCLIYNVRDRLEFIDISYSFSVLFVSQSSCIWFAFFALLMPINIFCEAIKWKMLAKSIKHISAKRAFAAVLAGMSSGFLLPNRVGEFAGKALSLPKGKFWQGSVLAVFASIAQLIITLLLGFVGIMFFAPSLNYCFDFNVSNIAVAISLCAIFFILFFYFNFNYLLLVFKKWKKLHDIVSVLQNANFLVKFKVLLLSLLRYAIFNAQNILILRLLDIPIPFLDSFFIFAIMYFVLTAFPTFILTDLPARSSVLLIIIYAWFRLNNFELPFNVEANILLLSFVVWFVNIVLPSAIGLLFLNKFYINRKAVI